MTSTTITPEDHGVGVALTRVIDAGKNPRPLLMAIGEAVAASTKRRFQTSTDPGGKPWAPNSPVTIGRHLGAFKGSFKKGGRLSKKGAARAAAKKPLIGETRSLSSNIAWQLEGNDAVVIGSPMIYAAPQQFGVKKGAFGKTARGAPIPWGDIPARPFLGISAQDADDIRELAADFILR